MKPTKSLPILLSAATLTATALVAGCQPSRTTSRTVVTPSPVAATRPTTSPTAATAVPTSQPAVAIVNGQPITLQELQKPLIDAYGLNVLLNLVQLNLAKQEAAAAHVSITPADIDHERQLTIEKMFKDADKKDYDHLLDQFLAQQRISRPEFDLVIEANAYLRKIAEPMLVGKITDANLQEAFRTLYGENVQVRDIQVANLQEIATIRQRLAAGEPFEKVAREMSRDPRTKAEGGLLPPFSREITGLSPAFKDAAFALKEPGEVSDPIQTGDAFHVIQLVRKIAPKAVKFEDVKDSVRATLYDRVMQSTIAQLRRELARKTLQTMVIEDPVLKKQFQDKLGKQQAESQQQEKARLDLEQQRKALSQRQTIPLPSTQPATTPSTEARERPPATKSGQ